jgi:hypothetical protein
MSWPHIRNAGLVGALAFVGICLVAAAPSLVRGSRPQDSGLGRLDDKGPVPYFIADGHGKAGYRAADRELALWALQAWQRSVGGTLRFRPSVESDALIRVYFANPDDEDFGETQPFRMNGKRGASVYIRPDVDALGPDLSALAKKDDLLRETIVYLTCLHELGHALGLEHTRDYRDIMYYFGYGGDIPAYFDRYRSQLHSRADIAKVSGLSDGDVARVRQMYAASEPPDRAPNQPSQ